MSDVNFDCDVSMAGLTTLGVGGAARFLARPESVDEIRYCLEKARAQSLEVFVLGGGSNLLVADDGFDGLVLSPQNQSIECVEKSSESVLLRVGAGCVWDDFVQYCVQHGYAGAECLSGIPGCMGAAPIQNIGAYGQEVSQMIESVKAIVREDGELVEYAKEDCAFGYRTSTFKAERRGLDIVVEVMMRLRIGPADKPRYPELVRGCGADCTDLKTLRETVLALRRSKSMVYDPTDPNHRSAGSFFVNPIVNKDQLASVREVVLQMGISLEDMPCFVQANGSWKLSAAWLMDKSGFGKGFGEGCVGLSTNHCLAIVNRGGARASDIEELARQVRDGVQKRFGVTLVPEPVYLGGII